MSKVGRVLSWVVRLAERGGRHAPWIAVLLCLPALAGGLALDDYYFVTASDDPWQFMATAFTVIGGGERIAHFAAQDLAWWAAPGLQLDFMRPVAAATHALDRVAWPSHPWLMHLHSIAWYALLVWLVRLAYRAHDTVRTRADLAAFVFAVSQAHAMNVGWLAGRNALLGATFVVAALVLHHRARTTPGWVAKLGGPIAFALALLANEGAVVGLGVFVARAFVFDRGRGRWLSLLPYAGLVVGWRVLYRAFSYGATNSGMYLDPASDPLGYAADTGLHAVVNLAGALGLGVLDPLGSVPAGVPVAFAFGLLFVAALTWAARERLRDDPVVGMWALALLLTTATAGTTLPTDRGLLLGSIAASVVIADLVVRLREPDADRWKRTAGGLLVVSHLMMSPLLLPARIPMTAVLQSLVDRHYDRLPTTDREGRHAILVSAPSDLAMLYHRSIAAARGEPFFASLQWLYAGPGALTLSRVGDDAIVIRSTLPWLAAPLDRGFRAELDFTVGQRIRRACVDAIVEKIDPGGHPTSVRFELEPTCDVVWLAWTDGGPSVITLPEPGASTELDPAFF